MADHLDAVPDHVAVAVEARDAAEPRFVGELGGVPLGRYERNPTFRSRQYRYANSAKVELLSPPADATSDNFVRRFLDRFGAQVHHLTLKVDDVAVAAETVRAAGLDVVDLDTSDGWWHEAFLRPSQIGGLVVQVAWSRYSDEEVAARRGQELPVPALDAGALLGPRLRHPDLDRARAVWELLGATVTEEEGGLVGRWRLPDERAFAPLTVLVEEGEPAGPVALRVSGRPDLPAIAGSSPPIEGIEVDA